MPAAIREEKKKKQYCRDWKGVAHNDYILTWGQQAPLSRLGEERGPVGVAWFDVSSI